MFNVSASRKEKENASSVERQTVLVEKYLSWRKNKNILFTKAELSSLKETIEQHHTAKAVGKTIDNEILKTGIYKVFREILLTPFKGHAEEALPEPDKALRRAAVLNKVDYIVSLINEFGVDIIDTQDDNPQKENTALHLAVENEHIDCIKALIALGANVDVENAHCQTPRQIMRKSTNEPIQQLILEMEIESEYVLV